MDKQRVAAELVKLAKTLTAGDDEWRDDDDAYREKFGFNRGDKVYYEQHGIGKTKYSVSYHDGKDTHNDGSPFFGIALFSNKKGLAAFIKGLKAQGYKERGYW